MSMIYECPSCHTPQASGRTACRHCGAEFDSPVPEDAFLPDGTVPEPPLPETVVAAASEPRPAEPATLEAEEAGALVYEAPALEEAGLVSAAAEPVTQETAMEEVEPLLPQRDTPAPPLEVVPPPPAPAETLPYQSSPYPAPAYQSAPTYAEQADAAAPSPAPPRPPLDKTLMRALLIAFPIVLVLVLGAVFFAHSLDSGPDSAPAPLPAIAPIATPAVTPTSSGTPNAPPYVLNGTVATTGANEDPRNRRMVGRWESKQLDFYVFNENKTGTRGSLTGKGPQGTFLWTLVQNHLILYGDKQEQLTYSKGPDEDTIFLRGAGGKYVQYVRTKP